MSILDDHCSMWTPRWEHELSSKMDINPLKPIPRPVEIGECPQDFSFHAVLGGEQETPALKLSSGLPNVMIL